MAKYLHDRGTDRLLTDIANAKPVAEYELVEQRGTFAGKVWRTELMTQSQAAERNARIELTKWRKVGGAA